MSLVGPWRREVLALCADECARAQAGFRLDESHKGHPRLVLVIGKESRFVVFPSTLSDKSRGWLNLRAVIRRELRYLAASREALLAEGQGAGISGRVQTARVRGSREHAATGRS